MNWLRITILIFAGSVNSAYAGIVAIVNKNNPTDSFERQQLVALYMGRNLYFADGRLALRLDHPPKSDIREQFYNKLVNKSVAEVNAYWARLLFTGRASPPQIVQDTEAIIEAVKTNPSAIGYIKEEDLVDSVKVVWRGE